MSPAKGGFRLPFVLAALSKGCASAALWAAKGDSGVVGSFSCRYSINIKEL